MEPFSVSIFMHVWWLFSWNETREILDINKTRKTLHAISAAVFSHMCYNRDFSHNMPGFYQKIFATWVHSAEHSLARWLIPINVNKLYQQRFLFFQPSVICKHLRTSWIFIGSFFSSILNFYFQHFGNFSHIERASLIIKLCEMKKHALVSSIDFHFPYHKPRRKHKLPKWIKHFRCIISKVFFFMVQS